jgi:thiamine-phosphate pyrophosphorylase
VAIGGIDRSNAASVIAAGVAGVAVIGAVSGADDPVAATRELVAAIAEGRA